LIILGFGIVLLLLICGLAGYAFSMFKFNGKKSIYLAFLISLMLPGQALVIAKFVVIKELGLLNSYMAVILPSIFSAVNIFLFKNYCDTIPVEIIESGRMDGASELQIFFKLILPLCKPIVGAIVIFNSIGLLSDYLWQMLMLRDAEIQTFLVRVIFVIMNNTSAETNRIGISLAGGTLLFIPLLLCFCIFSRYFTKGLVLGAMKE